MKSAVLASALATLLRTAVAVTGEAEGFAAGVTGGGSAEPVYPTTTDELVSYLGDDEARVIYLDREFDFLGTEGTATETGCAPWGTDAACQTAINQNGWCDNYQPDAPKVDVSYDKAASLGISVGSNKSLVGVGSKGVIKGKGIRMVSGANNVIIQNIHITQLNPEYVWGGDAITLNDVDMIWIDHVTTSLIGRQHIVLGTEADNRVTISNCHIDGTTEWSATCDGHHYWSIYFAGSGDMVTFKNNKITATSGRAPKVTGNTLLHAVNNYWDDNSGHAFEIGDGAMVLAEGNIFNNVVAAIEESSFTGQLFASSSDSDACTSALGHACQANSFVSSGTLEGSDTDFLSNFEGNTVADAEAASAAEDVASTAGFGTI